MMKTNKKEPVILGNIDPNKGNIWANDMITVDDLCVATRKYNRHIAIQNLKAAYYHRNYRKIVKQVIIYVKNL